MNLSFIDYLGYEDIIKHILNSYLKEFGERKFKTVFDKVLTSNKISGLISTLKFREVAPDANSFIYCINEIPYFIFASGQTQAFAAIIALQRWNDEVNSRQFLLSNEELKSCAVDILKELKSTFF